MKVEEGVASLRRAIRPVRAERGEVQESAKPGWSVHTMLFSASDKHKSVKIHPGC